MDSRRHLGPILILFATGLLTANPIQGSCSSSLAFFVNEARDYDYGHLVTLPSNFGEGEFTFDIWIRPDISFPVGSTASGVGQKINWSDADNQPYSSGSWWFAGNFLIDGHNNNEFKGGTFTLQFYGGGRVRWLFGDGVLAGPGGHWSVGAYPASETESLLDGKWHLLTLVRRFVGQSGAQLELWVDGSLIATELTTARTDMGTYWNTWATYPFGQAGWFFGAEKQAAIGILSQYEDYKGPIGEMRFWERAKSSQEISSDWSVPVLPGADGLVGLFRFAEGEGLISCDELMWSRCLELFDMKPGFWSTDGPPLGEIIFVDGFESGNTSAW